MGRFETLYSESNCAKFYAQWLDAVLLCNKLVSQCVCVCLLVCSFRKLVFASILVKFLLYQTWHIIECVTTFLCQIFPDLNIYIPSVVDITNGLAALPSPSNNLQLAGNYGKQISRWSYQEHQFNNNQFCRVDETPSSRCDRWGTEACLCPYWIIFRSSSSLTLSCSPMDDIIVAEVAKPMVFIEGGIHAREWISPATVTFIIHELVTNPKYECHHQYKSCWPQYCC